MSDVAIRVESLSKRYRRGLPSGNDRLTEVVSNLGRGLLQAAGRLWRRSRPKPRASVPERSGEFWALKDVSFEVKRGEAVGIIGRNGAGKSTLLKILSRITEPTSGRFGLSGRVGSLLEVGTGFHPDLTGRENVFLNGTFLGMSRREIRRKFDAIAAFAEIDDFLDTPVKWYSSGMQVRLGFAVAAHLEPEILIVDEALAVGDAAFQKKCLGKIEEFSAGDRAVLFVSHSAAMVQRLCRRSILMDHGRVVCGGGTEAALTQYLAMSSAAPAGKSDGTSPPAADAQGRQGPYVGRPRGEGEMIALREAAVLDSAGRLTACLGLGEPFQVRTCWELFDPNAHAVYGLRIYNSLGSLVAAANTLTRHVPATGRLRAMRCEIDPNVLMPGRYALSVGCAVPPADHAYVDKCLQLEVAPRMHNSVLCPPPFADASLVLPCRWDGGGFAAGGSVE